MCIRDRVYLMVFAQGALGYGLTSIMGAVVVEIFQGCLLYTSRCV